MLRKVIIFTLIFIAALNKANATTPDLGCDSNKENIKYAKSFLDGDVYKKFDLLESYPRFFACFFVSHLKVIESSQIDFSENDERMEVVWALRGLQKLTDGLRFTSKTNHIFNQNELTRFSVLQSEKNKNEFKFFGELMTSPLVYVAPKDAQMEIIASWKRWYDLESNSYNYKLATEYKDWYW